MRRPLPVLSSPVPVGKLSNLSLHVLGTQSAVLKGTERKPWRASGLWVGVHLGISKAVPREVWEGGWVRDIMCVSFPRVPYLAVARTFEKIEEVSAR